METRIAFVSNLPYKATEQDLINHFKSVGTIKEIIIETHADGKPKGIAFIQFESPEEVQRAVDEFNDFPFMNRIIHVSPRIKQSRRRDFHKENEESSVSQDNNNKPKNDLSDSSESSHKSHHKKEKPHHHHHSNHHHSHHHHHHSSSD